MGEDHGQEVVILGNTLEHRLLPCCSSFLVPACPRPPPQQQQDRGGGGTTGGEQGRIFRNAANSCQSR